MRIYLVAAEPSGDVLSAEVIRKIRASQKEVEFVGVGGAHMEAEGLETLFDTSELAVFGLLEGIKAFKTVKARVEDTAKDIVQKNPDALVLVDSWGFMWRVAQRAKELGYKGPRIKLVGPQVWATRAGRAKTLAENVDHLLCIHEFEVPFYQPFGLETTVIGNPALDRDEKGDAEKFRMAHKIEDRCKILLLLPGSRRAEIKTVAPILERATSKICDEYPDVLVVCMAAGAVKTEIEEMSKEWTFKYILVTDENEKLNAFASAKVALACSGTVTTEVALQNVPLVVGYKIGWVTWLIARLFLMKSKFITLLNVAAGKEVAPEFIQTRFTAKNLEQAVANLILDKKKRKNQISEQNKALESMGRGGIGAAEISARKILELASS